MEKEIDQIKEEEKLIHKENLIKQNRPFLLTRYVAAFIDFLIMVITFIVLLTCFEPLIINSTNYNNYVTNAQIVLENSGLYNKNEDNFFTQKEYDKTIYDQIITNYYSSDNYAKENNKLDEYNKAKSESTFYTKVDDNLVLNNDVDEEKLKNFLTDQYQKALAFVKTNPIYIQNINKSFTIFFLVIVLFIAIDVTIFYLIVPLCRKNGETIGQIIFKMKLIDTRTISQVKKWQILVRYIIILAFDYLLGATLYLKFSSGIMLLPILITSFCIALTKLNVGPHDLISQTMIVSRKDI